MTTSAQTSLTSISSPEAVLSSRQLAFFEGLAQNRAHSAVLSVLEPLLKTGGISRAELAKKINREPSQVTRWLGSPGNWTLQTLGILLGGLGYVPIITAQPINERVGTNYQHPAAALRDDLRFVSFATPAQDDDLDEEEVVISQKPFVKKSTERTSAIAA